MDQAKEEQGKSTSNEGIIISFRPEQILEMLKVVQSKRKRPEGEKVAEEVGPEGEKIPEAVGTEGGRAEGPCCGALIACGCF